MQFRGVRFVSAVAFEDDEGGREEAAGSEGEKDDGSAIRSLGCGWSGGGVIEALGAALRVSGGSEGEDREQCDRMEMAAFYWVEMHG
jgi:hypothetical protein